jgi:hypothetical protein
VDPYERARREDAKDIDWTERCVQNAKERRFRIEGMFRHANDAAHHNLDFLIEDFLPRRYLAILAGEPKVGKTAFATAIALAVAEGSEFAGMASSQAGVLWLSLEENHQERTVLLGPIADRLKKTNFFVSYSSLRIDDEECLFDIEEWIGKTGAGLIVIDPLHAAHSGRSLTDGWSARRTLAPLKHFCTLRNVSAIVLHHSGRGGGRVAESAQLAAVSGLAWLMTFESRDDGRIVTIRSTGRGAFGNKTWRFASAGPLDYSQPIVPLEAAPQTARRHRVDEEILEFLKGRDGDYACAEIAAYLGRNPNSVRNGVARLCVQNKIQLASIRGTTHFYRIAKENEVPSPAKPRDESPMNAE